jgi:hypothetical protein
MKDRITRPNAGAESSSPRPTPPTLKAWFVAHPKRSQRWLAKEAHCNQSMISMLVKGERDAGGKLAERLHALTGVPIHALLHASDRQHRRRRKRGPPALLHSSLLLVVSHLLVLAS